MQIIGAIIRLSDGSRVIVDLEDFESLNKYRWHPSRSYKHGLYARRRRPRSEKTKPRFVLMHRQVMGFPAAIVDHKNGNGLDNRRQNLRLASTFQNAWNTHRVRGQVRFHGVTVGRAGRGFCARIQANGRQLNLGTFSNEADAARAYDAAAMKYHGEFAHLNFPVQKKEVAFA